MEDEPEAMRARRCARRAFRTVIEANNGYVVKSRATACTPHSAAWPTRLPRRSSARRRIAICPSSGHGGSTPARSRSATGDYFGPPGAPVLVMDAGHGGQVLIADVTAALVPAAMRNLGEHRLRAFGPVVVLAARDRRVPVVAETLDQLPGPVELTSFVGRAEEVRAVRRPRCTAW